MTARFFEYGKFHPQESFIAEAAMVGRVGFLPVD
jgi:hypothetical protein